MRGNSHYSAAYPVVAGSTDSNDRQRSFWMSDVTITFSYNKWQVEAWVKNIENSAVNVFGEGPGLYLYDILPPRTFGVTVTGQIRWSVSSSRSLTTRSANNPCLQTRSDLRGPKTWRPPAVF